ncbi:ornithine cyclodeaminase family protein [Streptomyces sp. NPDC020747]|uniref:ornithine cyclodeaminase family protein n=1 Tax=Streptomyces sp. NPDC020747 TaxID=3365086 RepID=UPI0037B2C88B
MTGAGSTTDPVPAPSSGSGPSPAARPLLHITEEQTAALVDEDLALTAARAAFAVDLLARAGTTTLAVFGTGHQAGYEVAAVSRIRPPPGEVLVVGRTAEHAERMAAALAAQGNTARSVGAEEACTRADVIVTATTARADTPPLFEAAWVRPGTHVSCMGADAPGRRELPPELFARARVFCDLREQARRMGESRHASAQTVLIPLGEVLTQRATGRTDDSDITVFDSSGIGLQDLYLGLALLKKMDISL